MDDNRYFVRQIIRFAVAGCSLIAIVTLLTMNLLNGAHARVQAENAALSLEIPKMRR